MLFLRKGQKSLLRTDHPLGNNDLFISTRLFFSNDASDNNFSGIPSHTRTEIMINQTTPVTGTVYAYLSPLALILFLFSPKAHV
jgi:hypothetical protein